MTDGHSLTPGPFCVPLDDGLMSSLFVRCTPFHSCHMESDTPHLPAVVGVCSPLGAPKSDEGFGEAGSKCRHPKGSGSSVLSLTGVGCMVGLLQLYDD